MKKSVKLTAAIIIAAVVAIFAIYSAMQPLTAEVIEVKPQTVAQQFKEEGIVAASDEYTVYSLVGGEVLRVNVEEGQSVTKGDVLVVIDVSDMEHQLERLRAERKSLEGQEKKTYQDIQQQLGQLRGQLDSIIGQERQSFTENNQAQAQKQLEIEEIKRQLSQRKEEYEKIKILHESGAVSEKELEDARGVVKQLENMLAQQETALALLKEQADPSSGLGQYYEGLKNALQVQVDVLERELAQIQSGSAGTKQYFEGMIEAVDAQIRQVEAQISNSKIIAPASGIIQQIDIKEGMVITPQTRILTIDGTEDYDIKVYLLAEDVINVQEGMTVDIIQERKDQDYYFTGVVKSIAPSAVERVSALGLIERRVEVTVKPGEGKPELRPGYALDVQFTVLKQENKLAVPKTALFPYDDGDALWVVRVGRAKVQKVIKGMETDNLVVVEEGLQSGDKVVKNPQLEGIEEGKKIKEMIK
ncbi:MAG: efflux RND transporter periplasmic adaptor subunit [Clostridiaceae bacterium]|nr:efflux RND transporter periplasmic adaptor subunit [Clostridiaceae bacterium]